MLVTPPTLYDTKTSVSPFFHEFRRLSSAAAVAPAEVAAVYA